jgi:hypothetical protein
MPKFRVKYVYEKWYDLDIEASSLEEAKEKFWSSEFEEEPREVGGEVQDGVLFEEVPA